MSINAFTLIPLSKDGLWKVSLVFPEKICVCVCVCVCVC